jgi:hypothetical protein
MIMDNDLKGFYNAFISAVYGFVLVFGFSQFVDILNRKVGWTEYLLLATVYVTVLHFWMVFFASSELTFTLITAPENDSNSVKMIWFWVEVFFATSLCVPMTYMFFRLQSVPEFTLGMTLVAAGSLLWDVWAFMVNRYQSRRAPETGKSFSGAARELLFRWVGLDLLFVLVLLSIYTLVSGTRPVPREMVAFVLFALSMVSSLLDTVLFNPELYLGTAASAPPSLAAELIPKTGGDPGA